MTHFNIYIQDSSSPSHSVAIRSLPSSSLSVRDNSHINIVFFTAQETAFQLLKWFHAYSPATDYKDCTTAEYDTRVEIIKKAIIGALESPSFGESERSPPPSLRTLLGVKKGTPTFAFSNKCVTSPKSVSISFHLTVRNGEVGGECAEGSQCEGIVFLQTGHMNLMHSYQPQTEPFFWNDISVDIDRLDEAHDSSLPTFEEQPEPAFKFQ